MFRFIKSCIVTYIAMVALCVLAEQQIYASLEMNVCDRDLEIFGERKSAYEDYRSAWYDYEEEYAYNFSMD